MSKGLPHQSCDGAVLGLNIWSKITSRLFDFRDFCQYPQITVNRPRPLPCKPFPIHHLNSHCHSAKYRIMDAFGKASSNNQQVTCQSRGSNKQQWPLQSRNLNRKRSVLIYERRTHDWLQYYNEQHECNWGAGVASLVERKIINFWTILCRGNAVA
jgi:hypothetical protein